MALSGGEKLAVQIGLCALVVGTLVAICLFGLLLFSKELIEGSKGVQKKMKMISAVGRLL